MASLLAARTMAMASHRDVSRSCCGAHSVERALATRDSLALYLRTPLRPSPVFALPLAPTSALVSCGGSAVCSRLPVLRRAERFAALSFFRRTAKRSASLGQRGSRASRFSISRSALHAPAAPCPPRPPAPRPAAAAVHAQPNKHSIDMDWQLGPKSLRSAAHPRLHLTRFIVQTESLCHSTQP